MVSFQRMGITTKARLNERQKAILLRLVAGEKIKDIADAFGVNRKTVTRISCSPLGRKYLETQFERMERKVMSRNLTTG